MGCLRGHGGSAKVQLGRKILGPPEMHDTAAAIRRLGRTPSWSRAAVYLKANPRKQCIARLGNPLLRFLQTTHVAFYQLMDDPNGVVRPPVVAHLIGSAWIAAIWQSKTAGEPFAEFIHRIHRNPRNTKAALVTLHHQVWKSRGHEDFWIEKERGGWKLRRDLRFARPRPQSTNWDLRWSVCFDLIHETFWRGK